MCRGSEGTLGFVCSLDPGALRACSLICVYWNVCACETERERECVCVWEGGRNGTLSACSVFCYVICENVEREWRDVLFRVFTWSWCCEGLLYALCMVECVWERVCVYEKEGEVALWGLLLYVYLLWAYTHMLRYEKKEIGRNDSSLCMYIYI